MHRIPRFRYLMALVAVLTIAASCGGPGSWQEIEPPARGSTQTLVHVQAIACGGPTNCVALPVPPPWPQPEPPRYGEVWDGTTWKPIPVPVHGLHGLSCTGSWCMAIGQPEAGNSAPAWTWDGTSWTQVADLGGVVASDLDCAGTDFCVATGSATPEGGPIARRWDGATWTTISGNRTATSWLTHVDCLADGSCVVATYDDINRQRAFERWSEAGWSAMPHVGLLTAVTDLSCGATVATCAASGLSVRSDGTDRPVLLDWTGARWEPDPFDPGALVGALDCRVDGACLATTADRTLRSDGTSWRVAESGPPPGRRLACASATTCFTIDDLVAPPPNEPPRIHGWDGALWSPAAIEPNPVISDTALTAVSCATGSWCLAVGGYVEDNRPLPLIERWDGSGWTIAPDLPVPASSGVRLSGVSCPAVDRCVVVGSAAPLGQPGPFVARWDGTRWVDESASARAATTAGLLDVSCVDATCIAVGSAFSSVVALRSEAGGPWTAMPAPEGAPAYVTTREAAQISCAAPTACAASTVTLGNGPALQTNLSYWDGTSWSVPADTGGRATAAFFADVTCPAPGTCVAVAVALPPEGGPGVVATWTGAEWSSRPVSSPLSLVGCGAVDRCLATAGGFPPQPGDERQLTEALRWDGTDWTRVAPGAPTLPADALLSDLSCRDHTCIAVGAAGTDPLAYRYQL